MEKLNLVLSTIKEAMETISTEGKEFNIIGHLKLTKSTPESEGNDHSPSPPAITRDSTATTSANLTTSCHSSLTGLRTKHRVSFSTLGDDRSSQPFSQLTAPHPQGSTTTFPFGGFPTSSLDHSLLGNASQSPLLSLFGNSTAL